MNIEEVLAQLAAGEAEKTAEDTAAAEAAAAAEAGEEKAEEKTASEEVEISEDILKVAQLLVDNPEAVDALDGLIADAEEAEKTAEAEKLAEELEAQGRIFGRGQAMEQAKIAHAMGEIDDEYVAKLASVLGVNVEDIVKEAAGAEAVQVESVSKAKQDSAAGGTDHDAPAANAKVRPVARAEELKGLSDIAAYLKAARNNPTDLPDNG